MTLMWRAAGFCQMKTVGLRGFQRKEHVSPNLECTARMTRTSCRAVRLSQSHAGLVLQVLILLSWRFPKESRTFAKSVQVDRSKCLGHRCHAIFAQPAATKTRPGVLGAIAVQLANTKMKRANMAASNALLVPPRYCWDQTPFRTVAARLGPSTSPAVRLWSAFHAVMDWTAPFRRAFRLCRQDCLHRGSNSLPGSKAATSQP